MRYLRRILRTLTGAVLVSGIFQSRTIADEGMWLLNALPRERLRAQYQFEPTARWIEHVQQASVRFNNGGSGAFVSSDGLILTNHHIMAEAVQKLSTTTLNFLRDGFLARTPGEELKCEGLELNVLVSIENVTDQVNAAVPAELPLAEAAAARRRARSAIEKKSLEESGLRSDVVTLYQGEEYHLYRYKRYTDVRLVFVPEQQMAFFGGDPDNFEFPRFCLDAAFVRAYEKGQPVRVEHFFAFQPRGAVENELVFVLGHPGSTSRTLTVAELEFVRDVRLPAVLSYLKTKEVALTSWSQRSVENARRAREERVAVQNVRKVYDERLQVLLDPQIFERKRAEEAALQSFAKARPELAPSVSAWERLAKSEAVTGSYFTRKYLLEATTSESARTSGRVPLNFDSVLASFARVLFRAPTEKAKPSGERLAEYRDSNLPSLELSLFSNESIDEGLEQLRLATFLTLLAERLGASDPAVTAALGGKGPAARAAELISGSQVRDVAYRKRLYAMTPEEIAREEDPLIQFVRALDLQSRAVRKISDEQTEEKIQARAQIAKVRYAKNGVSVYPDATFTLRLAYGVVRGYEEQGHRIQPFATWGGTFERSQEHEGAAPFDLVPRWIKAESGLDRDVPLNFVSTCDIVGGNSGSPVINRAGECVGVVFDQNLYSLGGDYAYGDGQARAISVDVRGIEEALRRIYRADTLIAELGRE